MSRGINVELEDSRPTCTTSESLLYSNRLDTSIGALSREGNDTPLQSSYLESPMDRGAWWAAVHGFARSRTQLSDFTFTFHLHALEKEMAPHSSVLAWRIPGTGEPGGLPSMGSHRVGHDCSALAAAAAAAGALSGNMKSCSQSHLTLFYNSVL